jgi:hypothetical protein
MPKHGGLIRVADVDQLERSVVGDVGDGSADSDAVGVAPRADEAEMEEDPPQLAVAGTWLRREPAMVGGSKLPPRCDVNCLLAGLQRTRSDSARSTEPGPESPGVPCAVAAPRGGVDRDAPLPAAFRSSRFPLDSQPSQNRRHTNPPHRPAGFDRPGTRGELCHMGKDDLPCSTRHVPRASLKRHWTADSASDPWPRRANPFRRLGAASPHLSTLMATPRDRGAILIRGAWHRTCSMW